MMKTVLVFGAGCVTALLAMTVVDAARYSERMPHASVAAASLPMEPMESSNAVIKSGTPNFRVVAFSVSPDRKNISGVWAADGPSSFEWSYEADEVIYINEGQVDIEYLGRKFTLKPGQSAYFQAGTKASWTVPTFVRKSWTIHHSNSMTRWMRRFTAPPQTEPQTASPTNPA